MASIESTASSKSKSKEAVRVEALLPEDLRANSEKLITLLEDYYKYMNIGFNPSYELNNIAQERDIDTAEHYLNQIQKEIAVTIPRAITTDRVKLYKNLVKYYNIRGSTESIQVFFRILLNDEVEIYYPKKDLLIPSDGKWDPISNTFMNTDGFLSDKNKLQDSYFYQKFSYVIRTGNNVSVWKDVFSKLVHPSGFIFFGEIYLFLYGLNGYAKMPKFQPGRVSDEDFPILIYAKASAHPLSLAEFDLMIRLLLRSYETVAQRKSRQWSDLLKFYDDTPIRDFEKYTIQDGINKVIPRSNVGVSIHTEEWDINGFHNIFWPEDGSRLGQIA